MKIHVTQEDIDHGFRGDCKECPVARAVNRVLATGLYATAGVFTIAIFEGYKAMLHRMHVEERVANFIETFDHHNGRSFCQPFEFELPVPNEYLQEQYRENA